jgi:hypothetical protein
VWGCKLRRYKPVWRCVYCGWSANKKELRKEHILSLAFGGVSALPRASCPECAQATSSFEQHCARNIFGPLRTVHEYPARKQIQIAADDQTEGREIVSEDRSVPPIHVPSWAPPGIITNRSRTPGLEGLTSHLVKSSVKDESEPVTRLGVFESGEPLHFDAVPFARFLAKLAHVMAVAEYGLGSFKPYLSDLIRGVDNCPGFLVGGAPEAFTRQALRDHEGEIGIYEHDGSTFLLAQIRLFGFLGLPTYVAVIGEPTSRLLQRIARDNSMGVENVLRHA